MDRTKLKTELEDLGRQITAWSWAIDPLTDEELTALLPRTIDRVVHRLQDICAASDAAEQRAA
jgi:hypothetical protein